MATIYKLKAGYTLTATVNEGRAHVRSSDGVDSAFTRSSVAFGPYLVDREFLVDGDASVALAAYTTSVNSLVLTNDGAPDDAAQATLTVNPTGDDNGLTYTARAYGTEGNSIKVGYTDPSANNASLAVSVFRQAITVSLATGVAGAITSTAAEVKAAVEAHTEANQLVTVAIYTADSGVADDGSGVVAAAASTALSGGAGTGIGVASIGGLYLDTTNGDTYHNAGTTAVPDWRLPGEFLTTTVAVGAAVSHTNNTPVDVCTLALTPGEWDVSAIIDRDLAGVTATRYAGGISLTAATMPSQAGGSGLGTDAAVTQFATFGTTVTGSYSTVIPPVRVVVSVATTLHLVIADLFSAGTVGAFGTIRARRIK